jgi:hypothetical protein
MLNPVQHVERTKSGECECCSNTGTLYQVFGNMWMCADCRDKEIKLQAEHQSLENQQKRVDDLVARSRQIDQSVVVKADVFNAATVPIVELKAAIENNAEIPAEKKQEAFATELDARIQHLQPIIFNMRKDLLDKENELRMYQTNLQHAALTLRKEIRDKLHLNDPIYTPTAPKVIKPAKERAPKAKFSKEELRAAAEKYDVPQQAIQMLVTAKKMTPDEAGQHLKKTLG